jgi:hypothetical protein
MKEYTPMVLEMTLVEVVHVELPHEGGEPIVPEVFGQNDLLQPLLVEHANATMLDVPANDFSVLLRLHQRIATLRMLQSLAIKDAGFSYKQRIGKARVICIIWKR